MPSLLTRLEALVPRSLWLLYANIILYAARPAPSRAGSSSLSSQLCYMAQVPVLPYLIKSLHADTGSYADAYGRFMTLFGVVQFLGGLLAGPVLDVHGARLVLLASFAASVLCYSLTGLATGMALLFASRLPQALQHAVLGARAVVAEASSEGDRARLLGYIMACYGVGMTLGPALGGQLSALNLRAPAWAAAAGSLVSCASIAAYMPRTSRPRAKAGEAEGPRRVSSADLLRVAFLPGVPSLLAVKGISSFAWAVYYSALPLLMDERYNLDARGAGLLLSYSGFVGILGQAFLVSAATARFPDATLVRACALLLAAAFVGLAAAASVPQLCALLLPVTLASTLLGTVNTAQLTKAAPADLGTVMALDMSLSMGARVVSPTLATYALKRFGPASGGCLGAGTMLLLVLLISAGVVEAAPAGPGGKSA